MRLDEVIVTKIAYEYVMSHLDENEIGDFVQWLEKKAYVDVKNMEFLIKQWREE